jgi:hypothetical protein
MNRVIPAEAGISYAKAVPGFYSSSVSFVDLWVRMRSRLGDRDDCFCMKVSCNARGRKKYPPF